MTEISEGFLLTMAQIAATLIGLLLVGALFYAETGIRQLDHLATVARPYFRAGTVFVLSLYLLVLAMSLALVVLERWAALLFLGLGLAILGALVSYTAQARALSRSRPDLLHPVSAWLPWPPTLVGLALPWLLGGLAPDSAGFVMSMLMLGGLAFLGTAALVVVAFELAGLGAASAPE